MDGRSLHCWYLSLRGPNGRLKPPVSVRLVDLVPEFQSEGGGGGCLVRTGDVEIELGADFDEVALGRLLRVVRAC